MSDTNFTQPMPHGTGRRIAPLFKQYLLDPEITLNAPRSWEDLRDMVTQCICFVIRERAGRAMPYSEVLRVAAEMVDEREELGVKKYGEGLRADNGRDCMLDELQELLDAGMYATQKIEES